MPKGQSKAAARKENKSATNNGQSAIESSLGKNISVESQMNQEKSGTKTAVSRRGKPRTEKATHATGDIAKDLKVQNTKQANLNSEASTSVKSKRPPRSKSLLRSPYELRSTARLGRKRSKSEEPAAVSVKKSKVQKPARAKATSKTKTTEVPPKEKLKRLNAQLLSQPEKKQRTGRQKSPIVTKSADTQNKQEEEAGKEDKKQGEEPSDDEAALESADTAPSQTQTTKAVAKPTRKNHAKGGRKRAAPEKVEKVEAEVVKKAKVLLEIPKLPTQEGIILTVGQGDVGQLGLGLDITEKFRPAKVAFDDPVVSVAAGGMHTVFLTNRGEVYTFGCNDEGALGRETEGKEELESSPGKVALPEKVVLISAGDSHTAVLTERGHLFIWGNFRNSKGAMGLTTNGVQKTPLQILDKEIIVNIASGSDHLVCLTQEGQVYTFGCGEQGQLGRIPEDVANRNKKDDLGMFLNPAVVNFPVKGEAKNKATDVEIDNIWCEYYATFARTRSGQIYCFGLNNCNQLGVCDKLVIYYPMLVTSFEGKKWQEIRGGQHHTLALDDQGHVYALGRKEYGRLGLGDDCEDKSVPTLIPTLESTKCASISCGNVVSFAVAESGDLYSWGMGTTGAIGHGSEDDVTSPKIVKSKSLVEKIVLQVSGGGQHAAILAQEKPT